MQRFFNIFPAGDGNGVKGNCAPSASRLENKDAQLHPEYFNPDMAYCPDNGVRLHHIPNMLKLTYEGILAKNGAHEMYAVIGYGEDISLDASESHLMQRTSVNTFELLIFRKEPGSVSIAFRDAAGNLDDNSGKNYVFYEA